MGIVLMLQGCLGVEHCNCHSWDRDQAQPGSGAGWKGGFAEDSMLELGGSWIVPRQPQQNEESTFLGAWFQSA